MDHTKVTEVDILEEAGWRALPGPGPRWPDRALWRLPGAGPGWLTTVS